MTTGQNDSLITGLRLGRRGDGALVGWTPERPEGTAVTLFRCFPWLRPTEFLSLRDKDGAELALIERTEGLEPESRRVLEETLAVSGFTLEVTGLDSVELDFELRNWKVRTKQGPRTFQTEQEEWPQRLPGGGLLIRDVAGDLYHIAHPEEMDRASRKRLWAFVD